MKNTYVVFYPDRQGARIYVNPEQRLIDSWERNKFVTLLNPVRVNLLGVPPHLWSPNVAKNEIYPSGEYKPTPNTSESRPVVAGSSWLLIIAAGAVGAGIIEAIQYFLK